MICRIEFVDWAVKLGKGANEGADTPQGMGIISLNVSYGWFTLCCGLRKCTPE